MEIMDFFKKDYKLYTINGKTTDRPVPEQGIRRFFYLLTSHFSKLVTANLLFLLFCLPVVSIPAAIAGMARVTGNLVRDGNTFVWTDFIAEFKQSSVKSMKFGLLWFVPIGLLALAYFKNGGIYFTSYFPFVLLIFGFGLLFILSCYGFYMIAFIDLPLRAIIRNTVVFLFSETKRNTVMFLVSALIFALCLIGFPYSVPFMLLIVFAPLILFISTVVDPAVQKRVIEPFGGRQEI